MILYESKHVAPTTIINITIFFCESYVYWTVHHCGSWRIKDQLYVTCYFISLLKCSTCFASACNTDTTPTQPHRNSNTHRAKNNTTNVVIQQNNRKLLMMTILMPETCWAHKKWNKIASDIKLVFYSSKFCCIWLTHHSIFIYVLNTSAWQTLNTTWKIKHPWIQTLFRGGAIFAETLSHSEKNANIPVSVTVPTSLRFALN